MGSIWEYVNVILPACTSIIVSNLETTSFLVMYIDVTGWTIIQRPKENAGRLLAPRSSLDGEDFVSPHWSNSDLDDEDVVGLCSSNSAFDDEGFVGPRSSNSAFDDEGFVGSRSSNSAFDDEDLVRPHSSNLAFGC